MSSRDKKSGRHQTSSGSGRAGVAAPGAGGFGRSRGTSFLQREIKVSTTSFLDREIESYDNEEEKENLRRMYFKMLNMASSDHQSWHEKENEELLDEIDKLQKRSIPHSLSRQNSTTSGNKWRRLENTGHIRVDKSDGSDKRVKNITKLLKIPYELNKMSLLGTAVSSNNMRIVRFFCKILERYDEKLSEDEEKPALRYCLELANDIGHTPLMLAAENGYVDLINHLVMVGADMTCINKYGMNCLHLAVERNRVEAVKVLLDHATTHLQIDTTESFTADDQDYGKADKASKACPEEADTIWRRYNDCFWMVPCEELKEDHRKFLKLVERSNTLKDDTYDVDIENEDYENEDHHKIRERIDTEVIYKRRLEVVSVASSEGKMERRIWRDGNEAEYIYQPKFKLKKKEKDRTKEDNELQKELDDWQKEDPGPLWFFAGHLEDLISGNKGHAPEVQNVSDDLDRETIYKLGSQTELKGKPMGIISRQCKGVTKYKVAWEDRSIFATWHDEDTITAWNYDGDDGEKTSYKSLIEEFNWQGDNIIRVLLNSRNIYGKSAFISCLEFDRPEILEYLIHARHTDDNPSPWLQKKDNHFKTEPVSLMKYNLLESRNGRGATTLHFAIKHNNALVKLLMGCYLGPVESLKKKGSMTPETQQKVENLMRAAVTLINARDSTGSTPLSWVCGVSTDSGYDNALLLLDTLDKDDASGGAQAYLNHSVNESKSVLPNADSNYLMRAAKAGNLRLCKLFINRKASNAPNPLYKSAAEYAFEAKYYDVGYFLDKELLKRRLSFEFVSRVYANVQVEYLSELDELVKIISNLGMCPEGSDKGTQIVLPTPDSKSGIEDEKLVEDIIKAYHQESTHIRHPHFKRVEFVSRDELHSVNEVLSPDSGGDPQGDDDYRDRLPIKDLLLLETIKRLREDNFPRHEYPFINEICDAYVGMTGSHQKKASGLNSVVDVLNYEPCKLYWFERPSIGGEIVEGRYLVRKIGQDRKMTDVKQHAMDHYMARIDLFGRVARLAAVDDDTFKAFCSIIKGSVIKNPIRFRDEVLTCFYEGLRDEQFVPQQLILQKLVLLNGSLDSARKNSMSTFDSVFEDENSKIVSTIREIFACRAMLDPDTVKNVVMPVPSVRSNVNPTVMNARAFYMPVVSNALKLELKALFGTQQISGYIEKIFRGNLRFSSTLVDYRRDVDIFNPIDVCRKQLMHRRTEAWEHLRYSPYAMFLMEALSKIIFLGMIFYVVIYKMGDIYEPPHEDDYDPFTWKWYDYVLGVLLGATILRELGEFFGSTADQPEELDDRSDSILQRFGSSLYKHFFDDDVWNFLDLLGILCVFMWAILKSNETGAVEARAFLSVAAIPKSLGLLRYASVDRDVGNLIITLISMSKDVYSFLFVLVVALFGFLATMRGLFQFDHLATDGFSLTSGFSTFYSTQLTLIDASLGNYAWDYFDGENPYFELGLFLQIIFIIFIAVILFNLLIAKMTSTYEQKEKDSLEDWEFAKAEIVKQFMLIGEVSPLCMLPVPLNLITTALSPLHAFIINTTFFHNPLGYGLFSTEKSLGYEELRQRSEVRVISLAGTVADCVLGLLSAPFVASFEILVDIFEILSNVLAYYEKIQKKLAEISNERAPIVNILLASMLISLLALVHTALHIFISPILFAWYIYSHLYATFTKPVELEFMEANGPRLQIRYKEDPLRKFKPKPDLQSNSFSATIVRGYVSRKGKPFSDRPTRVRISTGPYSTETSAAVMKCTNELPWFDLPMNKKDFESFPQSKCNLPIFPLGGDDLMRNLKISIITAHADGDLVTASTRIHASQLHRWIYNGRFEGKLKLVSHLEIPLHHHGSDKLDELLFIERPVKEGAGGDVQPCECVIERAGNGEVLGVQFYPGFGYEEKKKYRVFHLFFSDWENQDRVNFSSAGKTERVYSYKERSAKCMDGTDPELFVGEPEFSSGSAKDKVRFISKYEKGENKNLENMDKDLENLKRLMGKGYVKVGFRGDKKRKKHAVNVQDFCGKNRSFDTISMVTFEITCEPSPTSEGTVVPVLTSPTSKAELTVAFYFDVDMSTHLHQASLSRLNKNYGDTSSQKQGLFGKWLLSCLNTSTAIAPLGSSSSSPGENLTESDILLSKLLKEDHTEEFDGHSRFDKSWSEFLESPELFSKEDLNNIFSFLDGGDKWKGNMSVDKD
jgi:hypothetical protein